MLASRRGVVRPQIKDVVLEASRSLAHLDAEKLEELAASCKALNREQSHAGARMNIQLAREAIDSQRELAFLASVLEATRANLRVLRHLNGLYKDRAEYLPGAGQN